MPGGLLGQGLSIGGQTLPFVRARPVHNRAVRPTVHRCVRERPVSSPDGVTLFSYGPARRRAEGGRT